MDDYEERRHKELFGQSSVVVIKSGFELSISSEADKAKESAVKLYCELSND